MTEVRENPKLRVGTTKHHAFRGWRYRLTNNRLVAVVNSSRMEMIFNGGGRSDGFDYSLLRRHWETNKLVRRDIGALEDLGAALKSLLEYGWIIAPRIEPYVSLMYAQQAMIEATEQWDRTRSR